MRFRSSFVAAHNADAASHIHDHRTTDSISEGEKSALCAFEQAALSVPAAAAAAIDLAIEACRQACAKGGTLNAWGTAAAPTLSACLQVLKAVDFDSEGEARIYDAVLMLRLPGKTPVKGKTALLAVLLCQQPQTPQARKDCSRFACLVTAALNAGTQPEQAATYLATTTLSEAISATRRGGNSALRILNPIRKTDHPTLWKALSSKDDPAKAMAEALIVEALERAEDYLRDQVTKGAAGAA